MSASQETPRPPATPEFGAVTPDGPTHIYPMTSCMRVKKFSVGRFDNNVYVIECTGQNEALVVDASAPPERLQPELEGLRVVGIVITHRHGDHTTHLRALREALAVPVYAHPADEIPGAEPLEDGAVLTVGEIDVRALHTPGHTPGSICLLARGHLFSGDALFPGGPGNTENDPDRFAAAMRSVDRLFAELDDATHVSPGHGLDTTIGRERRYVEAWRARGW